jgi:hypothetical protein
VDIKMRIRKLLSEPLLHFAVIGVALFAGYRVTAPDETPPLRIVVTEGVVGDLIAQHVAARGREPSAKEITQLIESWVHDEIVYREGVALGLDRDDAVVKRRVRQKFELMAEEDAAAVTPTDADLSAYLAGNPARFRLPAIVTFEQVYLGPASDRDVVRIAAVTGNALRNGASPWELGRPTLLARRMTDVPADLVARDFGGAFAATLEQLPVGEWSGPIESSFGAHYVRLSDRTPAVVPALTAVRDQVIREWENDRRQRARADGYAKLRARYHVSIETGLAGEAQ